MKELGFVVDFSHADFNFLYDSRSVSEESHQSIVSDHGAETSALHSDSQIIFHR